MLLFYVRHGDPIYVPDSLTEQGSKQAEALVKRMKRCDPSKIFVSSSNRARLTAKPTADALGIGPVVLDWCNEGYAWDTFSYKDADGKSDWMFYHPESRKVLASEEIRRLDKEWYTHPFFSCKPNLKDGIERIRKETDAFMLSLGYKHVENGYVAEWPNDDRVALFAHQGFGFAFMSALLDIPYPMMSLRFDFGHSSMTVVELSGEGFVVPKVLQFSNDSHIFASDLKTSYNNCIEF